MEIHRPLFIGGNKNYSSWTIRAWLALKFAGIDFDEVFIPLYTDDHRRRILEYGGNGQVPLLKTGQDLIWDSMAICEHVAEQVPDMWPAAPGARGRARSVCQEMHSGFRALRAEMPMNARAADRRLSPSAGCQADIDRVLRIWSDSLGDSGGPWLFGELSIADAVYAPVVSRFETYGIDVPATCRNYMDRLLGHEQVLAWYALARVESEVIEASEVG